MLKDVILYTIDNCPYCSAAKSLLGSKNVEFKEVHVDRSDVDSVKSLQEKTGMRTFPQIFFGEKLIGGYTDLQNLADTNGF